MRQITFTEEQKKEIIDMYQNGATQDEVCRRYSVSEDIVRRHLKQWGIKKQTFNNRYSEDDKDQICNLYQKGDWKSIFRLYPEIKKHQVYRLACDRKISIQGYHWNQEDIDFLKRNFNSMSYVEIQKHLTEKRTIQSISTKAIKLGLTQSKDWSNEELDILKKYYSVLPIGEVEKLLPKRTHNAILIKAGVLNIRSYYCLNEKYTQTEKDFISENWNKMTDSEIGEILGKTAHGIKDQRLQLGLLRLNKDYTGYYNLQKLFRGQIYDWKENSQKACNYKCVLTGSKDYQIHHLYSFNKIFDQTMKRADKEGIKISDSIEDYTKEELDELINIFSEIHDTYPLGVCIRKDLHTLFHQKYGQGGNTPEQWERFVAQMKQENIA